MRPDLVRGWKERWAEKELLEKEVETKKEDCTLDAELWREWLVDRTMSRENSRRTHERKERESRRCEKRELRRKRKASNLLMEKDRGCGEKGVQEENGG